MQKTTESILTILDSLPGGRMAFLEDIAAEFAHLRFYTAQDVADRYQVSKSLVSKWATDGLLVPSLKVSGGTARYTLADLIAFENSNRRERKGDEVASDSNQSVPE